MLLLKNNHDLSSISNIKVRFNRTRFIKSGQLYLLLLLPIVYVLIFSYGPMVGAQIAFRNFMPRKGIWGSEFAGLEHFIRFIDSVNFWPLIRNTLGLSLYNLSVSLPFSVIFALSINYVKNTRFKKSIQMISYAPHFISTVVMCGLIIQFLNPRTGMVNIALTATGLPKTDFMASAPLFSSIYVWSNLWQTIGFSSIIYLAVLSSVNPELHEAATIDGANIVSRIWHIDIPCLLPTAITLLILNTGQLLNVGFEKVLLLQTPLNRRTSEIIATFVYKVGLTSDLPNYSFATAIGLFQSFIGFLLLIGVNRLSKRLSETSLW